jgi:hypothetical protein
VTTATGSPRVIGFQILEERFDEAPAQRAVTYPRARHMAVRVDLAEHHPTIACRCAPRVISKPIEPSLLSFSFSPPGRKVVRDFYQTDSRPDFRE